MIPSARIAFSNAGSMPSRSSVNDRSPSSRCLRQRIALVPVADGDAGGRIGRPQRIGQGVGDGDRRCRRRKCERASDTDRPVAITGDDGIGSVVVGAASADGDCRAGLHRGEGAGIGGGDRVEGAGSGTLGDAQVAGRRVRQRAASANLRRAGRWIDHLSAVPSRLEIDERRRRDCHRLLAHPAAGEQRTAVEIGVEILPQRFHRAKRRVLQVVDR